MTLVFPLDLLLMLAEIAAMYGDGVGMVSENQISVWSSGSVEVVGTGFGVRDEKGLHAFGANRDDVVLVLQDSFYG